MVLICISLLTNVEHFFIFLLAICLLRNIMQILCPFIAIIFVFLLLNSLSSLNILDISSLSNSWFANILSQYSLHWFFCCAQLFSLLQSHLLLIVSESISENFSSIFSYSNFIVVGLMFNSFTYFVLILV
jgi:hypothetical protein